MNQSMPESVTLYVLQHEASKQFIQAFRDYALTSDLAAAKMYHDKKRALSIATRKNVYRVEGQRFKVVEVVMRPVSMAVVTKEGYAE